MRLWPVGPLSGRVVEPPHLFHVRPPLPSSPCSIALGSGLADCWVLLSFHPCLPFCQRLANSKAPSLHRALPRFLATAGLTATVSPSADFPVFPVIRPTLLHRFLDGSRTVSPVARHALVTVLPLPPRRSDMPLRSARVMPCCLRPEPEGSASEFYFLSRPPVGSLSLRPGNSLTIPKMALSVGFRNSVSFLPATQATRVLTLTLVGLSPTEHASLRWTSLARQNSSRTRKSATF